LHQARRQLVAIGSTKRQISRCKHDSAMADWTPRDDGDAFVRLGKIAIGAANRSARLELGVSQRQFSVHVGVSQSVISRLEAGRLSGIRWQTLARIVGVIAAARGFRLPRAETSPPA
jgi:ribosome-binding protein aMBF1 (putative translation factor)